jgi:hypothetical protein
MPGRRAARRVSALLAGVDEGYVRPRGWLPGYWRPNDTVTVSPFGFEGDTWTTQKKIGVPVRELLCYRERGGAG